MRRMRAAPVRCSTGLHPLSWAKAVPQPTSQYPTRVWGATSGTVSAKGNKFYASTPNVKVWNNGSTQWTYTRSTNEVTVSRPNDAQQMTANPYKFLSLYKSGYALSMTDGGQYEVHLKAIHPGRSIQEAYITISHNYHPTKIRMRQGKTWTTITLSGFRTRNIPNSTFEFNKRRSPMRRLSI